MRYLLAVLAVALPAALAWTQYRTDGHERALGAVASELAGRPVTVRCQGLASNLLDVTITGGEVAFDHTGRPADETLLKRGTCRSLREFARTAGGTSFACVLELRPCEQSTARTAQAVRVLAHEAWHLRGVRNEAETECYALQTTALAAARLGASAGQAHAVAAWNLKHAYPHAPSRYRSTECRDGGPWDLRPQTTAWP